MFLKSYVLIRYIGLFYGIYVKEEDKIDISENVMIMPKKK